MFDHLTDPTPPDLSGEFRRKVVDGGRRHQRRTRLAAGGAAMAPCVAIAGFAMYLRSQADELEQVDVIGLVPADTSPTAIPATSVSGPDADPDIGEAPPLAVPINVLVAGVDRRPAGSAVTGSRADTIAVVRIDPTLGRVSMLSLPRDLWVPGPSGTSGRLNAYAGDGGLVTVVSELLDIELNHYIEVDFDGFESLIDIAGGVSIPFEQDVRDLNTGFRASAGCSNLSGADALAYVRSRKLESFDPVTETWSVDPTSDIGRIARQQEVMRRVYTTVFSQDYGTVDKVRLVNEVVDDLTVDAGLDIEGVQAIFNAAAIIGPGDFVSFDLASSVTGQVIQGNSVLLADPTGIVDAVDGLLGNTEPAGEPIGDRPDVVGDQPAVAAC